MPADEGTWSFPLTLADIHRAPRTVELAPTAAQRARIAKLLDLEALNSLAATVGVRPWLDGAELQGRWRAEVVQICSVSADLLDTTLEGRFELRVAPADSAAAVTETEAVIDPDAEDPPDVLDGETVDLAAYVVEHLALEIDPFPRKPGAQFEPPAPEQPASPFAVLQTLRPAPKAGEDDEG